MVKKIKSPTVIEPVGNKPKIIKEYIGMVNSNTGNVSIAEMSSSQGWIEPGQKPDFDEYTIVLEGELQVETEDETITIKKLPATIREYMIKMRKSRDEKLYNEFKKFI